MTPILLLRVNSSSTSLCPPLSSFGFVGFPYPVQPEKFFIEPGRIGFIAVKTVITGEIRVYHRSRTMGAARSGPAALVIAEEAITVYKLVSKPVVGKPDTLEFVYVHTFITFSSPYLFDPFPHP